MGAIIYYIAAEYLYSSEDVGVIEGSSLLANSFEKINYFLNTLSIICADSLLGIEVFYTILKASAYYFVVVSNNTHYIFKHVRH